jgi:hypothetical protein
VLLFFVETNKSSFFLSNAGNVDCFGLFSSTIENSMSISEVNEGIAVESEVACEDEAMPFASDCFVESDQVLFIVVVNDHSALVVG